MREKQLVNNLTIHNYAPHIVTFWVGGSDFAFCAVAEANEKDPLTYSSDSGFGTLFYEAAAQLPPLLSPEKLPLDMANAVESVLIKWQKENDRRRTQAVLYSGVLLEKSRVHVCTAGDCRVHLLQNDTLLEVSRDHNLVSDSDPPFVSQDDSVLRQIYLRTTTRTIGAVPCDKKPECLTWDVAGDKVILVCSSRLHRFRIPNEYLSSFLSEPLVLQGTADGHPPGVLIRIDSSFQ